MTDTAPAALRTLIVDDEPLAIERLEILCANCPELSVVGHAGDGEAGLELARQLLPDLVLLDIEMPKMDGIAAARALRAISPNTAIVLVTAFDNFAVEAFDLDICDYLLKPVSPARLQRAIARVLAARELPVEASDDAHGDHASEFWVSHRSELIRVAAMDIERIEAERDYMRLHTGGRSYLLHETISMLEQRLNPLYFQRIHRSHIVRRDLINGLRHEGGGVWYALLGNDQALRIGRKYLADVKKLAGK
jgi:DNA-binding LytR/AlgR family response regulator